MTCAGMECGLPSVMYNPRALGYSADMENNITSRGWGTREDAMASVRRIGGGVAITFRHKTLPIVGMIVGPAASGRFLYALWHGKAAKPSAYYSSNTRERAVAGLRYCWNNVEGSLADRAKRQAEKATKRANLKASDFWTVGDTVYTSWGYDQTNVDFFQIVTVKARSVVVRQVLVNNSDHGQPGGGKIAPRRYEYSGPEIFCPIDENGHFSAGPCHGKDKPSYRHGCSKWEGRSVYTSSDR